MALNRRALLSAGGLLVLTPAALAAARKAATQPEGWFNVRDYGAKGDGKAIDTPAVERAIDAAAMRGGGTIYLPAGSYACYTIHLKSNIQLYLDEGATLLAASTPLEGTMSGGYDNAEPQGDFEPFQDYGHNHWRNSLIYGEDIHDIAIAGPGLIWGKGLSRGHPKDTDLPDTNKPGVGNKAIALKNCHNVTLQDFSILQGGWFAILATGVDNLTIDNLKIDTNRDGMDIDCCRNVRVSNCSVNSPWDDGICPKSSYALGYARPTENVTIANCYVTGAYQLGSMLGGSWIRVAADVHLPTGRIKMGTESNGGFLNITISNCVFDRCRGLALETVDGAHCEDITITGITMRGVNNAPMFLRLGRRLRGPEGSKPGTLKRILISNVTSYGAALQPSLFAGLPEAPIEDIKLNDIYLHQLGGYTGEVNREVPEYAAQYPEPSAFGDLPASGLYARHVRGLEASHVEVVSEAVDPRVAFWLEDVADADFSHVRTRNAAATFNLNAVRDFRLSESRGLSDTILSGPVTKKI
jgi:polygalacturonase